MINDTNFIKEMSDLGYIVRPPHGIKNYYTIGSTFSSRYIHLIPKAIEGITNIKQVVIDVLEGNHEWANGWLPSIVVNCICDNKNECDLEHHSCPVFDENPFRNCIHIIMRDNKSDCIGCKQLYEELMDEVTNNNSSDLLKELMEEKKVVHNLMLKFIPEYRDLNKE